MKTLEEGPKKVQQLCELLKKESLEPAKREAEALLEEAHARARDIIAEAEREAEKIHEQAKIDIEREKNAARSLLAQAAKQTLEALRQALEKQFFHTSLYQEVMQESAQPRVVARLIEAVIEAIQKEGFSSDLALLLPKKVAPEEVSKHLTQRMITQLKTQSISLGDFAGGVQVKLKEKQITIDVSDETLIELLDSYRKGFRHLLFQTTPKV